MTDNQSRVPYTPARKVAVAIAIVLAIVALIIELLVALDRLPDRWASIGGGFVILALAVSVIGRSIARKTSGRERT